MKQTKLELQQINSKLAAENCRLREENAGLRFDLEHVAPRQASLTFKQRCAAARAEAMKSGKCVRVS